MKIKIAKQYFLIIVHYFMNHFTIKVSINYLSELLHHSVLNTKRIYILLGKKFEL